MSFARPLVLFLAFALPAPSFAQTFPCESSGRLISLGRTLDGNRSLWLSTTTSDNFTANLQKQLYPATPPFPIGATPVDEWTAPGLHLSISSFTAGGGAGAHTLFLYGQNCVVDVTTIRELPDITLPPYSGNGGSGGGTGGGGGSDGGNGSTEIIDAGNDLLAILRGAQQSMLGLGLNRSTSISERIVNGLADRRLFGQAGAAAGPDAPPSVNLWVDARTTSARDDRYGIDADGRLNQLLLGVDYLLSPKLVAGLAVAAESGKQEGYGGFTRTEVDGFVAGPYIGWRVAPNWIVDGWLAYGTGNADYKLAFLDGGTDTRRWFVSANATGHYDLGFAALRPKLAVFWGNSRSDAFAYTGSYAGYAIQLNVPKDDFDYGTSELSAELSRTYAADGTPLTPYVRLGARYDFERPNDGELLTADLDFEKPSPWSGSLRIGLRAQLARNAYLDAGAGYLSFGQNDLDVWDGRIALNWLF